MTIWRPGMKAVCIKDGFTLPYGETPPEKGRVYTIREVRLYAHGASLLLHEINNEPNYYQGGFVEASFTAVAFRPLVEKTTDISVFTAILDRENRKADRKQQERA